MHILFIDDDPEDVELFTEIVQDIDSTIRCSAITRYSRLEQDLKALDAPDIIFLDGHIGPVSGKECLRIVKRLVTPHTKIIIHSGAITEREENDYRKMDVDEILTKGFLYNEVRESFAKIIQSTLKNN